MHQMPVAWDFLPVLDDSKQHKSCEEWEAGYANHVQKLSLQDASSGVPEVSAGGDSAGKVKKKHRDFDIFNEKSGEDMGNSVNIQY